MKHNERARVAQLYLTFIHPFRKKCMNGRLRRAAAGGGLRRRPAAAACVDDFIAIRSKPLFAIATPSRGRSRTTVAMSRRWRFSWRPQAAASQRPSPWRQLGARFKLPRFRAWKRPPRRTFHQGSTHLLSSIHQARALGCQTCAWPSRDSRRLLRGLGHSDGQRVWVTKMCLAKSLDARREPCLGERRWYISRYHPQHCRR